MAMGIIRRAAAEADLELKEEGDGVESEGSLPSSPAEEEEEEEGEGDQDGQSLVEGSDSGSGSGSGSESDSLDSIEPRKRRKRVSSHGHGHGHGAKEDEEEQPVIQKKIVASAFSVPSRIKRSSQAQAQTSTSTSTSTPAPAITRDHDAADHGVTAPLDLKTTFSLLGLSPWLVQALANVAIRHPTTVQRECIPPILAGRDCIGGSRTGSGKTLAFAAPILQRLNEAPSAIFAVVVTPTRELALQIYEQFKGFAPQTKLLLVTGGSDMRPQAIALARRPHVVICTPGRLADHIRTASGSGEDFGLRRVRFVVLDEADRLLAAGNNISNTADGSNPVSSGSMLPDVETCLSALPPPSERQTLLFTATMTPEVHALRSLPRTGSKPPPFVCEVDTTQPAIPPTLVQTHVQVPVTHREHYLHVLLTTPRNAERIDNDTGSGVIVFTNRAATADLLHRLLRLLGHRTAALHAGLPQRERNASLARFRAGAARVLVATDVAARGLDIPEVGLVINYDVPRDPDAYVHRVGRTARAGRRGEAVTLVGQRDVELVLAIERRVGRELEPWREEGVNLETRVVRDALKLVSEKKREALLEVEEGREVGGKRKRGKLSLRAG